jgi:hypothetical protein
LKEIEDFKYLVRFPPHKLVASTLIFDITYFKMQKDKVLVSLKVWNGDIDPYDALEDVWVQIRGVLLSGAIREPLAKLPLHLAR